MKGHIWQPAADIRRSQEDPEVWVPFIPDGHAEDHYIHAGLIRKVKHYTVVAAVRFDLRDQTRWIRKGDDAWELQVKLPAGEQTDEEELEVNPYDYTDPDLGRLKRYAIGLVGLIGLVLIVRRITRKR